MKIVVQKYGGSSVATTERLFNVCKHIIKEKRKENQVVVVVSAQGKTTDNLIKEENEIIAWENGKDITFDWDTGEMWADGEPLKWHRFKHNFYFMAGDNVFDSYDSRNWGLVPEEYIVGVVEWVFRKVDGRWTRVETEE